MTNEHQLKASESATAILQKKQTDTLGAVWPGVGTPPLRPLPPALTLPLVQASGGSLQEGLCIYLCIPRAHHGDWHAVCWMKNCGLNFKYYNNYLNSNSGNFKKFSFLASWNIFGHFKKGVDGRQEEGNTLFLCSSIFLPICGAPNANLAGNHGGLLNEGYHCL